MQDAVSKRIQFIALLFFIFPFFAGAQSLELRASPQYPEVGGTVTVSLFSFEIDLNQADISWNIDGKLAKKGKGLKSYSFVLGDNGNTIRVVAVIDRKSTETTLKINPASMDVLWEAIGGYEPPFYKGKLMPTKGTGVRVVAIPQIRDARGMVPDASTFVYGWSKDGSNFTGQSGYGMQSFSYLPQILDRDNTIQVSASGLSRQLSKSVTIAPVSAEIHFYEYDLAYGPLYNKAVKTNQVFRSNRINILAEPYFIFTDDLDSASLVTEWRLNGMVTKPEQKNLILLDVAKNVDKVDLSFSADNNSQLLQKISRPLRLNIMRNE